MDEERLVDIEIKLTRTEDMLDALNQVIYEQQKKIERLEALYTAMLRRMPEPSGDDQRQGILHEKPPHY